MPPLAADIIAVQEPSRATYAPPGMTGDDAPRLYLLGDAGKRLQTGAGKLGCRPRADFAFHERAPA